MSYYVQYLIKNTEEIRNSIIQEDENNNIAINFEDDVYMDLLTVEKELTRLDALGLITEKEKIVYRHISEGMAISHFPSHEMNRKSVGVIFSELCQKVAFSLGDYFTDDGFYEYMCEKHQLDDRQEQKLRKLIFGRDKTN